MKFTITEHGHLLVQLESTADMEWAHNTLASRGGDDNLFLADMLEYAGEQGNAQFVQLSPADIGALTQAPILTDHVEYDKDGKPQVLGNLYWYPQYEVSHFGERLLDAGSVTFAQAPKASQPG